MLFLGSLDWEYSRKCKVNEVGDLMSKMKREIKINDI